MQISRGMIIGGTVAAATLTASGFAAKAGFDHSVAGPRPALERGDVVGSGAVIGTSLLLGATISGTALSAVANRPATKALAFAGAAACVVGAGLVYGTTLGHLLRPGD